ncbi:putative transcriptional regulator [Halobacteroides halobius DSM 5150]|uniref:Putative transcriptional regulator n=1 Tax=Halobacteroides halobius (strain ATCC 35273 / DSM 5150 / MD-1) TaxID=748449 RepID=L0KAA1_HALHC|nr:metalloregulator ArsR/SmtB family transcription factor [Halobacteroides halobius]AGB41033.1 putative transcriptional regulator [Halobacteroides halobius DSM 5150]
MEELVTNLKAIADANRLKLLALLLNKDYCVKALAKELEISESAVSQHLKKLREAGLVIGIKKGYWVHYSAKDEKLVTLADKLKNLSSFVDHQDNSCCKNQ